MVIIDVLFSMLTAVGINTYSTENLRAVLKSIKMLGLKFEVGYRYTFFSWINYFDDFLA